MIQTAKNKLLIISLLLIHHFLTVNSLYCGTSQYIPSADSILPRASNKFLNYGLDKITNTYIFSFSGNYLATTNFGDFRFVQSYRGIGLKQDNIAFRDDENFSFEYSYPILSQFKLLAAQNVIFTSDERTSGNNVLSRINGLIGGLYSPLDNINFKLLGGYEHNKQLKVSSPGLLIMAQGNVQNFKVSNFVINSVMNAEHLVLNLNRTNSNVDFYSGVTGFYENDNQFGINLLYKLMKRDILSSFTLVTDSLPIETRFENRFSPDLRFLFTIQQGYTFDFRMNISNLNIDKSCKKPLASNPVSNIIRTFNELQFGLSLETAIKTDRFNQITGINYYSRAEENKTKKKFQISDDEIKQLQEQEFLRDNNSIRTRLYSLSSFMPTKIDTISLSLNVRKFSYDTPSDNNHDDRDEISYNVGASYLHRFDESFSAGVFGEVQLLHLVFLKSERSAMNNWNRIFRLGPEFSWKTSIFSINPKLEVLANYTVYDFEDKSGNIRSYSFRQIGYRDTISVTLSRNVFLQSRINFRYFERGILFWNTFSESPQNKNLEYFIKLLFVSNIWNNAAYGLGARVYLLKQGNISPGTISISDFSQFSWGPESFLIFRFTDGSNISLQGWYEFQYINKLFRNNIPNLFLSTSLAF